MKRTIALMLALLMVAPMAAACGKEEKETEKETQDTAISTESGTESEETEAATPNWDAVDKTSLNGMTVDIYGGSEKNQEVLRLDFDDYTSDILEDGIYDRNRLIEKELDCKINVYYASGSDEVLKTAVNSGDGSMDLAVLNSGTLVAEGNVLPFNYIESLDMTQPWWDQALMKDMQICGMSYFAHLDYMFQHYDDMHVVFYNKKMLDKYQLEDPYDLHKNEQWTIEKYIELIEVATQDTNGDGVMGEEDDYGVYMKGSEGMPMIHASGMHLVSWDDDQGTMVLNMVQERYVNILEAITPIYNPMGVAQLKFEGTSVEINQQKYAAFNNGNIMFLADDLGACQDLRSVEDDYGLIMCPRYDYAETPVVGVAGNAFMLPKDIGDDNGDGVDDFDQVAQFLQAVGAYTHDMLIDVYIEKNIIGKGLRDEHSVEMFYEMIQYRGSELCVWYFQGYGFSATVNAQTDVLWGTGVGYASAAQTHLKKFNLMAKRLVEKVQEQVDKLGIVQ